MGRRGILSGLALLWLALVALAALGVGDLRTPLALVSGLLGFLLFISAAEGGW